MTHEDWIKLTPEQQQIEVRSCLGFDKINEKGFWGSYYWKRRSDGWCDYYDPDYLTDLNAMHDAEKMLSTCQTNDGWSHYNTMLHLLTYTKCPKWYATAAQRAEAFVLTMTNEREI